MPDQAVPDQAMPNLPEDNQIEPDAAEFIAWAIAELSSEEVYAANVAQVKTAIDNFYTQSAQEFLTKLVRKLDIGAREHGSPYFDDATLAQELENEYTDIMGWLLIRKWNQLKKNG